MASSLASFDNLGSSLKLGSEVTSLCRSVKRSVRGSVSGWSSESSMARSSELVHFKSICLSYPCHSERARRGERVEESLYPRDTCQQRDPSTPRACALRSG